MTAAARLAVVGIAVFDRTFDLPELPNAAGKFVATGYRESGGGMAATAAVAAASLGGDVLWCGRLGDDLDGQALRVALARHGVDSSAAVVQPGSRTPTSAVLVDAAGERMLAVFPGEGLPDGPPDVLPVAAGAGAVLADARWTSGAAALFAAAAALGIPRVLDGDRCGKPALDRLVPLADHVVFSEGGLAEFTGCADPAEGLHRAARPGQRALGVTLGAKGSLWRQRHGELMPVPAPAVAARDTNGCGDVFHGAYALALAEGRDAAVAVRFATAAAALKAERGGGWGGMPDRATVDTLLRRGW